MRLTKTKTPPSDPVPAWRLRAPIALQQAEVRLREAQQALGLARVWLAECEYRDRRAADYRKRLDDGALSTKTPGAELGPTDEQLAAARETLALREAIVADAEAAVAKARELPRWDAVGDAQQAGVRHIARVPFVYEGRQFWQGEPVALGRSMRNMVAARMVEEV